LRDGDQRFPLGALAVIWVSKPRLSATFSTHTVNASTSAATLEVLLVHEGEVGVEGQSGGMAAG
jgi:hypothetical protein